MEHEIIKNDIPYPPACSRKGDNAYYLKGCPIVGRSPSYASCLFKIEEIARGRELALSVECSDVIKSGACAAIGMKQQEQLAGVALYYFPRRPPQAIHVPFEHCGDFGVRITNLTPPHMIPKDRKPAGYVRPGVAPIVPRDPVSTSPVSRKKPSLLDTIDKGSYSDALNAAPVPQEKKLLTKEDLAKLAMPGESLVDAAKRILNKIKGS